MGRYKNNKDGTKTLIAGIGNTNVLEAKIQKTSNNITDNVQSTDTASKLISAGEYFINKNGDLCVATSNIALGSTITIGTNCALKSLGDAVSELNDWENTITVPVTISGVDYGSVSLTKRKDGLCRIDYTSMTMPSTSQNLSSFIPEGYKPVGVAVILCGADINDMARLVNIANNGNVAIRPSFNNALGIFIHGYYYYK